MKTRDATSTLTLLGALLLTGCVRGNVSDGPSPVGLKPIDSPLPDPGKAPTPSPPSPAPAPAPAPSPSPAPAPAPAPTPSPPPAPAEVLPPLAPVPINLDDNHPIGIKYWPDRDPTTGLHGETVDGYQCFPGNDPPHTYHVHTHLSIFLDKVALRIPEDIGIVKLTPTSKCVYSLHTHDHSGKLHVEGPAPAFFTLGDFFMIWGQPLSKTQASTAKADKGTSLKIWVNGKPYTGDPRKIQMTPHADIVIEAGPPFPKPPVFTNWGSL